MLRSYDSRFRQTKRSPVIYQSQECNEILGGEVKTVLSLPADGDNYAQSVTTDDRCVATKSLSHDNDSFWNSMPRDRKLLVIATPYRPGSHTVTKPKGFVPILSELRKLHDKGFVHGDIRAFNTVFNEEDSEGYLIDFDYGGRKNEARYPKGYRRSLDDGHRLGSEGHKIEPWHDWYALGQLIFALHIFLPPDGQSDKRETEFRARISKAHDFWDMNNRDPTSEEVKRLENLLCELDEQGWTVRPGQSFGVLLASITDTGLVATNQGATGSPPEKNP